MDDAEVVAAAVRSAVGEHVDRLQLEARELPEGGGGEGGDGTAGHVEGGGHRGLVGGPGRTADPEDPIREPLEVPLGDGVGEGARGDAQLVQLGAADHPVLLGRDAADLVVTVHGRT